MKTILKAIRWLLRWHRKQLADPETQEQWDIRQW